jgi:hypothetical protein
MESFAIGARGANAYGLPEHHNNFGMMESGYSGSMGGIDGDDRTNCRRNSYSLQQIEDDLRRLEIDLRQQLEIDLRTQLDNARQICLVCLYELAIQEPWYFCSLPDCLLRLNVGTRKPIYYTYPSGDYCSPMLG